MSDIDEFVDFDPVRVLGCSEEEAAELLRGRRITPGEVETVALSSYQWWRHLRDPRSYWVTTSQAARLLHLAPSVVRRMLDQDRLPYVVHSSGVRLMRRHEIILRSQQGFGPEPH
jgi:hypothetical protein